MRWLLRGVLAMGASLVAMVCLFGAFVGIASASQVGSFPWSGSPAPTRNIEIAGECNEAVVVPGVNYLAGYRVQVACQMEVPAGLTVDDVAPSIPAVHGWNDAYSGGSYSWNQTNQQWARPSPAIYAGYNYGSASSCYPTATSFSWTPTEPAIYYSIEPGSGDGAYCNDSGNTCPTTLCGSSVQYPSAWQWWGQVHSYLAGPTETISGHSMQSVSLTYQVIFNSDPQGYSGFSGGNVAALTHPTVEPAPGIGGPQVDGGECATGQVTQSDDTQFDGGTWASGTSDEMFYDLSGGSVPSYFTGVSADPAGFPMLRMDNMYCGSGTAWYAPMPSNYATGGSTLGAAVPCTLTKITFPVSQASDGAGFNFTANESYDFKIYYSGVVDKIAVDPTDLNDGDTSGGYTGTAPSGSIDFGGDHLGSDTEVVTPVSSPVDVAVKFTNTGEFDPNFYCIGGGATSWWGDGSTIASGGVGGTPSSSTSTLDACYAAAGWDLYNPITWVLGALHDGYCIAVYLVDPPASQLTASAWDSPFTQHVPGLWVADAVDAADTVIGGVNTGIASGACSAPTINPDLGSLYRGGSALQFKMPEPQSCGSGAEPTQEEEVGSLFGWRGAFRDFLVFGVWLSVFVVCWRMMPFSRPGDGVDTVAGWGLNESGDQIATFWTNEPSDGG